MNNSLPFHARIPEAGGGVYHTHERCRVAMSIATDMRVIGAGEDRRECPFCFLLRKFQVNHIFHGRALPASPGPAPTARPHRPFRY